MTSPESASRVISAPYRTRRVCAATRGRCRRQGARRGVPRRRVRRCAGLGGYGGGGRGIDPNEAGACSDGCTDRPSSGRPRAARGAVRGGRAGRGRHDPCPGPGPRTWSAAGSPGAARSRRRRGCSRTSGSAVSTSSICSAYGSQSVAQCTSAPGREPGRGEVDELRLDQAALVVALLGPGVGEVDAQPGERAGGEHLAQQDDRVAVGRPGRWSARSRSARLSRLPWPGVCTSTARMSVPGSAAAICAVASPMPKPISRTTGQVRVAEQLAEVDARCPSMSSPHCGHSRAARRAWPGGHPAAARLEAADPPLVVRAGGIGRGPARRGTAAPRRGRCGRRVASAAGSRRGVAGASASGARAGGVLQGVADPGHSGAYGVARPRRCRRPDVRREPVGPRRRQRRQRPAGHLTADRQRGGGGRRRRVQHVHRARALRDQEVVHQRAVAQHRLGADAGRGGHQIAPRGPPGSRRRTAPVKARLDSERCSSPAPYRQCRRAIRQEPG